MIKAAFRIATLHMRMDQQRTLLAAHGDYLAICAVACVASAILTIFWVGQPLPVLGLFPAFPTVLGAAMLGLPLMVILRDTGLAAYPPPSALRGAVWLLGLGAVLALPPIAIDLTIGFPRNINLPLPQAAFFYPAIALVAEVAFHLMPLAILAIALPVSAPRTWVFAPVIFIEPLFQVLFASGPALQSFLVFCSVSLFGAVQLWLFQRYGFGAMFGLRIAFYLFWHIIWGAERLAWVM